LETRNNWSLANCLCMDSDKTNFMVFNSSKNNGIAVLVNGHQIAQVHIGKYLGLYVDDDLNWKKITLNTSMVNY